MNPPRKRVVMARPDHEVKVIRHHAVCKHLEGKTLARQRDDVQEYVEVVVPAKDSLSIVAAIEDVVADAANRSPCRSSHAAKYRDRRPGRKAHSERNREEMPTRAPPTRGRENQHVPNYLSELNMSRVMRHSPFGWRW